MTQALCACVTWCLIAAALATPETGTCHAEDPAVPRMPFATHTIDQIGRRMGQTALADVDRDGDLDWIAGETASVGGRIWWWEYRSPDQWVRHDVGVGRTDVGGAALDINGDGWIDILSGATLLINPGNPRSEPFNVHEVGTIPSHDTEFADIDGDGRMDAIANSDDQGLFWYEIPEDPTARWASHTIATADDHEVHGGVSPKAVGDLDGDGDQDVATGQAWYENLAGDGTSWRAHKNIDFGRADRYGLAVKTWVLDLDGDRDNDIVQAEADHPDARVAWLENDGQGHWTIHVIKEAGGKQDFHSLVVADFDLDGDQDVFSGGGPLSAKGTHTCFVWENLAGQGNRPTSERWTEHIIARLPCHEAVGADVDGDGDVDICTKPWSQGNRHVYLRNLAIESR